MERIDNTSILRDLARLHGIQTAYQDAAGRQRRTSSDTLLAILQSMGASLHNIADVPSAWRQRRQAIWQRVLEPAVVAWDGKAPKLRCCLPAKVADSNVLGRLKLETGECHEWWLPLASLTAIESAEIEGTRYHIKQLQLPYSLPWGYHSFTLEVAEKSWRTLIISAPVKSYHPLQQFGKYCWGVFIPLYALHGADSWGAGDLSDLRTLADFTAKMGGDFIATLPLLATINDQSSDVSPYRPLSRLMWDEFYIDLRRVPELQQFPGASTILESSSIKSEIHDLQRISLVDYSRQSELKRSVLEVLCHYTFTQAPRRLEALQQFTRYHPDICDYARFRAIWRKEQATWRHWPAPLSDGLVKQDDYDVESERYYLYAQWLAHQQMEDTITYSNAKGIKLYLDLPVGIHPDGYDAWRYQSLFDLETDVGAPPDSFNVKGQNWGFPPQHPEKAREQGYDYTIRLFRHSMPKDGILRIDHIMALHRLYWIPRGFEASNGSYVRYRAEELYAILCLESQRNNTILVGEDLGTVPREVRRAMRQHQIKQTYVAAFEAKADPAKALRPIPNNTVANLNTHDTPPFAAFWSGQDIENRLCLGLMDADSAFAARKERQTLTKAISSFLQQHRWLRDSPSNTIAVLRACLAFLSSSAAELVMINLEDLFLENQSQNIPGTTSEYPNWRRKARYSLEKFRRMPKLINILKMVHKMRAKRYHTD